MKECDIDYIVGLSYRGMRLEEISRVLRLKTETVYNIVTEWRKRQSW